jgi:hypothetical protein
LKLPAVLITIGELVAPGETDTLNVPVSDVAVCVVLSALRQATVCPILIVPGLGEKDSAPFMPTMVIVTSAGVTGVGDDGVLVLPLLQPVRPTAARITALVVSFSRESMQHLQGPVGPGLRDLCRMGKLDASGKCAKASEIRRLSIDETNAGRNAARRA